MQKKLLVFSISGLFCLTGCESTPDTFPMLITVPDRPQDTPSQSFYEQDINSLEKGHELALETQKKLRQEAATLQKDNS